MQSSMSMPIFALICVAGAAGLPTIDSFEPGVDQVRGPTRSACGDQARRRSTRVRLRPSARAPPLRACSGDPQRARRRRSMQINSTEAANNVTSSTDRKLTFATMPTQHGAELQPIPERMTYGFLEDLEDGYWCTTNPEACFKREKDNLIAAICPNVLAGIEVGECTLGDFILTGDAVCASVGNVLIDLVEGVMDDKPPGLSDLAAHTPDVFKHFQRFITDVDWKKIINLHMEYTVSMFSDFEFDKAPMNTPKQRCENKMTRPMLEGGVEFLFAVIDELESIEDAKCSLPVLAVKAVALPVACAFAATCEYEYADDLVLRVNVTVTGDYAAFNATKATEAAIAKVGEKQSGTYILVDVVKSRYYGVLLDDFSVETEMRVSTDVSLKSEKTFATAVAEAAVVAAGQSGFTVKNVGGGERSYQEDGRLSTCKDVLSLLAGGSRLRRIPRPVGGDVSPC